MNQYLVTAIVSTYNSEYFFEHKLIDLLQQTLGCNLEIIIIDSNSLQKEREIIKPYLEKYSNIRYIRTETRETIYQAWNRAVKLAHGKYLTNSNTDDLLKHNALEILAAELDNNPDVSLVYGDHFTTNMANSTFENHIRSGCGLKPDFHHDIMLTGCHMGPFPMWRKSIHEEIGYFDEKYKSAGDYEFWCRIALKHKMKHIKQFVGLYYNNFLGIVNKNMRISTAETNNIKKQYANLLPESAKIVEADFCYNKKTNDCDYVNICMVTYNRLEFTKKSIESLIKFTDYPYVLTVIDNNSTDGAKEYLESLKQDGVIKNLVLLPENVGVAKAANIGWLLEPQALYYLKLDNDIVFLKHKWLQDMVKFVEKNKSIGAIAYNFEPVSYQLKYRNFVKLRYKKKGNLGGACILIPKRTSLKLGYWNEEYGLYGEEDADYGARIRFSGLLNAYMPDQNIGLHLPAGKAAIINPETFKAEDGIEEEIHKDYRDWKDELRKKNIEKGSFSCNYRAYKKFLKPFFIYPEFAVNFINKHFPEKSIKISVPKLSIINQIKKYYYKFKIKFKI